jgi:hypothetical protein
MVQKSPQSNPGIDRDPFKDPEDVDLGQALAAGQPLSFNARVERQADLDGDATRFDHQRLADREVEHFIERIRNDARFPVTAAGYAIEARATHYETVRNEDQRPRRDLISKSDTSARLALMRKADRADLVPSETVRTWVDLDARDIQALDGVVREESAIRVYENATRNPVYRETLNERFPDLRAEANGAYSEYEREIIDKEVRKGADMEISASVSPLGGASVSLSTHSSEGSQRQDREVRREDDREMDRARLEAFFHQDRERSLRHFPDLRTAYALRDASQDFANERLRDTAIRQQFQDMTDSFIRDRLARGEAIAELRGSREHEIDTSR